MTSSTSVKLYSEKKIVYQEKKIDECLTDDRRAVFVKRHGLLNECKSFNFKII